MNFKKLVIVQKDDVKSRRWAKAAVFKNVELIPQPGSPIKAPYFLAKTLIQKGRPSGYVVRYLNDYESFAKTILRLVSEITLVSLCIMLRVEIYWVCHNVDKETLSYFSRISSFRRWLFASLAKNIYVTDPLLVPYAQEKFPDQAEKIDFISFGQVSDDKKIDCEKESSAIDFIKKKRIEAQEDGMTPVVLYCAGSPGNKKYVHFDHLESLISCGKEIGYSIIAVVAGEFQRNSRGRSLLESYKDNSNICVFARFTNFSNQFVCSYVDFYWRGYDDWSVPFTIYEACTLGKPVLALDSGFLPELVRENKLGRVIDSSFTGLDDALKAIFHENNEKSFEDFLKVREWSSLSERLSGAVS